MGILATKITIHQLVEAARRIEGEACYSDPWDGGIYCRYCGVAQCSEQPCHDDDCPVTVVALVADTMTKQDALAMAR